MNAKYLKDKNGNKFFPITHSKAIIINSEGETLLNKLSDMQTEIGSKVDKDGNKVLSTNDFTTDYKNKLEGIDAGANKTIVDSELNDTSANPVQNKIIKGELNKKLNTSDMKNTYGIESNTIPAIKSKVEENSNTLGYNKSENLFDGIIELGGINPENGELTETNIKLRSTNFIKVQPNSQYAIRRLNNTIKWVIGYDENKIGITDSTAVSKNPSALAQLSLGTFIQTFTTTPTTHYIKWYDTSISTADEIMINEGTTALPYEPYKPSVDERLIESETQISDMQTEISDKESTTNKVTSISASSTDIEYPSAKVVYNKINEKVGFTNYPTRTTAGVAKVETNQNYAYGLKVDSNGFLQCVGANESEIKTGSNDWKPITPYNSKYLMKEYGISNKTQIPDIQTELDNLAKSLYVVYVDGTSGDDNNDGLTKAKAFKTLDKAVSLLSKVNGLHIFLSAGTYDVSNKGYLGVETDTGLYQKTLWFDNYNRTTAGISEVVIQGRIRTLYNSCLMATYVTFDSNENSSWATTYNGMYYIGECATCYLTRCVVNNNHYESAFTVSSSRLVLIEVTVNNNSEATENRHLMRTSCSTVFLTNVTANNTTADVYYRYPSLIVSNKTLTERDKNTGLTICNGGNLDDIKESVVADNMIKFPYQSVPSNISGAALTVDNDGVLTINGSTTKDSSGINLHTHFKLEDGIYTICANSDSTAFGIRVYGKKVNSDTNETLFSTYGNNPYTFVVGEGGFEGYEDFSINGRVTYATSFDNVKMRPMLEKGSIAHNYQPYKLSRKSLREDLDKILAQLNLN